MNWRSISKSCVINDVHGYSVCINLDSKLSFNVFDDLLVSIIFLKYFNNLECHLSQNINHDSLR